MNRERGCVGSDAMENMGVLATAALIGVVIVFAIMGIRGCVDADHAPAQVASPAPSFVPNDDASLEDWRAYYAAMLTQHDPETAARLADEALYQVSIRTPAKEKK